MSTGKQTPPFGRRLSHGPITNSSHVASSFREDKPAARGMKPNEEDRAQWSPSAWHIGCGTEFPIPSGSSWWQPWRSPATGPWGLLLWCHLPVSTGKEAITWKRKQKWCCYPIGNVMARQEWWYGPEGSFQSKSFFSLIKNIFPLCFLKKSFRNVCSSNYHT